MADKLMRLLNFSAFNGLVEQLIREEYERRHGPLKFPPEIPEPITLEPLAPAMVARKSGNGSANGKRRKSKKFGKG